MVRLILVLLCIIGAGFALPYSRSAVSANSSDGTVRAKSHCISKGFEHPVSIARGKYGRLYVAQQDPGGVRTFEPFGAQWQIGNEVAMPADIVVDAAGRLFVSDAQAGTVTMLTLTGEEQLFARGLSEPMGMGFDPAGQLLVAEHGLDRIIRIAADGQVEPVTRCVGITHVAATRRGLVWAGTQGLYRVLPNGLSLILASGEGWSDLAATRNDLVYALNSVTRTIWRIGGQGGFELAARLEHTPAAVTMDRDGECVVVYASGSVEIVHPAL